LRKQQSKKFKPRTRIIRDKNNPNKRSIILPKNIKLSRIQSDISAYRSNISNLFTETDVTLTDKGYLKIFTDNGYSGDVQKALTMYEQDDLINGLMNAFTNLANTRLNFNLPNNNKKERIIWETWAKRVNITIKNVLPGVDMLNGQIILTLLQTGMAVIDYKWGTLQIGRKEYEMPMTITIIPTLGTRLAMDGLFSGNEKIYASVHESYYKNKVESATTDQDYTNLFMDYGDNKYGMLRKNAYAIKYRYTPNNSTLYPLPFLKPSFESIALRHKLLDADISLLELIINKIIQIKVGDEKNPPKPTKYDDDGSLLVEGDLDAAQELFENMSEEVEVIATPYYYKIDIIMPDTTVLLDQKKYIQSTYNIMSNFGIMLDPSSSSNSTDFDKLNLVNYKNGAISLQKHVAGWYTWLATQIVAKNGNKIKATPTITFDTPQLDAENSAMLKSFVDSGYLDIYTLLEKNGLESDTIVERLKMQYEAENQDEKLFKPRATFKQEVINPNGESKETANVDDKIAKSKGGKVTKDE